MRSLWEWLLDEKVVLCAMILFFSGVIMVLIKWDVDKEYVSIFGSGVTGLTGALLRGITQPQQTDSTQTVATVTTVTPKSE